MNDTPAISKMLWIERTSSGQYNMENNNGNKMSSGAPEARGQRGQLPPLPWRYGGSGGSTVPFWKYRCVLQSQRDTVRIKKQWITFQNKIDRCYYWKAQWAPGSIEPIERRLFRYTNMQIKGARIVEKDTVIFGNVQHFSHAGIGTVAWKWLQAIPELHSYRRTSSPKHW